MVHKGNGGVYVGVYPRGAEPASFAGILRYNTLPVQDVIAMAVSQTPDEHEAETRERMRTIIEEMADGLAHDQTQILAAEPGRDDMFGYEVTHPVTPAIILAKRGTTDDYDYEWNRIHVTVASSSIGTARIMEIKRKYDLEVTDVWQTSYDRDREMGQHDEPALTFSLEPRE